MSLLAEQGEIREAFGRQWLWPRLDHFGWEHPLENWPPLADLIEKHVPEKGVVLQAGGCCGMYPWLLSEQFETVYTFELDTVNFAFLAANCAKENIISMNAALGNGCSPVGVDRRWEKNVGNHHVGGVGPIPMLRIDALNIPRMDALLLDAEAHETQIVYGALDTIARCKPSLIVVETITNEMVSVLAADGYDLQEQNCYDRYFLRRDA